MALADIFGRIESGSTTANPNNDAISSTGARGFLQQFPAFQHQFAGTTGPVSTDPQLQQAGLNEFASQAVRNNPGITVGDLYAEYNRGTGNPGRGATFADLTPQQQQQVRATGVNPDTPASSIINSGPGNDTIAINSGDLTQGGTNMDAMGNPVGDTAAVQSGGTVGAGLSYAAKSAVAATGIPDAIVKAGNTVKDGVGAVGNTIGAYVSSTVAAAEAFLLRGGVMLLAVVLLLAAAWMMVPRDTKTAMAKTVLK